MKISSKRILPLAAVIASAVTYTWFANNPNPVISHGSNVLAVQAVNSAEANLFLGNPSNATANSNSKDNYLVQKEFFTLSYNDSRGEPNWVSWRLTKEDIGDAPRAKSFSADETLPLEFNKIRDQDYTNSGFDRGHCCDHEDRSATITMSYATFVMTNIIPQAPNLNQKAWERFEAYCRTLVLKEHQRLYIIAGPSGKGGVGSKGAADTIANGRVTVPAYCWKVVVVVHDEGKDDLAEFNKDTRIITVIMPNENTVGTDWTLYRNHTVADIEKMTGYNFFDKLPSEIEHTLENKVDNEMITGTLSR